MNASNLVALALISAGLLTVSPVVSAQTMEKIASSNKITVSYREAAVPFSYLIGPREADRLCGRVDGGDH